MTETKEPLKIINLQAENIKKLVAIDITPDSSLVQITGKNGAGKTSVLDSIWWTLTGGSNIQDEPIRKGADSAHVRLDMGELIVTRKFKRKDDTKYTTSITVENADGARYQSPQTMLDDLIGTLSLDPLEFARMRSKDQFDALRKFVPEIDFDQERIDYGRLYDARRDAGRDAKRELAVAANMKETLAEDYNLDEPCPFERVDVAALIDEVAKAGEHNSNIEERKRRRQEASDRLEEINNDISAHEAMLEQLRNSHATLAEKIKNAEELPEPINVEGLRGDINAAEERNQAVDEFEEYGIVVGRACQANDTVEAIEKKMAEWQETRDKKLAAATLPVDGLAFADNEVLLDGVPFNQASDAQQLQVSVAMAMAASPTLRLIRIRDGSLLDDDSMKLLAKMADAKGYQIWIERVDSSGKVGFVIEDGSLKGANKKAKPKPKKEGK